jgi:hypothetical protein
MSEGQLRRLSERQQIFLQISARDPDVHPGPVRLMSASDWRTARSLVARGFGRIDHVPGKQGQFIASDAGASVAYPEREPRRSRR